MNHRNLQALTLRQEQVNAVRESCKKSDMTGNPKIKDFKSLSLEPPGSRAQASLPKGTGGSGDENVMTDVVVVDDDDYDRSRS